MSLIGRLREAEAKLAGHSVIEHRQPAAPRLSLIGRMKQLEAEQAQRDADPWRRKLEAAVQGIEAISTVALMELIGCPKTTGTARRIAKIMRSMQFVPIKSRRLMPGGFRDTIGRGWARPLRELGSSTVKSGAATGPMHGDRV
jgi:hypothetical protein